MSSRNTGIAPEVWEKLFAVLPDTKISDLAVCGLGDETGSKLAEVLPRTKLVNLK